jgi:hypothetical protein
MTDISMTLTLLNEANFLARQDLTRDNCVVVESHLKVIIKESFNLRIFVEQMLGIKLRPVTDFVFDTETPCMTSTFDPVGETAAIYLMNIDDTMLNLQPKPTEYSVRRTTMGGHTDIKRDPIRKW